MEAKLRALDQIATRQSASDEKLKEEAEHQPQLAPSSQSAMVQ